MQTPQSTWEHLHRVPFKAGKNKLACLAELVDGWQSITIQTFLNEFVIHIYSLQSNQISSL
jgi:hypothetical protein